MMVETRVHENVVNVTACAGQMNSELRVAIINKDESKVIRTTLRVGAATGKATLWRLTAPSVESKPGVRLAGAEVSPDGTWADKQEEQVEGSGGQYTLDLPAASAALVFLS